MPSFRSGKVSAILQERPGLQRVEVDLGGGPAPAYVLTQLTGSVALGDRVVVNTTAVELGLGTGGWHVVHWNLEREHWSEPGPGHVIKARYTSLQADVGSAEEHAAELVDVDSIEQMPVVVTPLHSQVPAAAAAFRTLAPDARLVYVMTDGAALPLALSDLVAAMRDREMIDATVTYGHAFGGDYEAVSAFSALAVARHIAGADAAIVAMGPGIVGTGTRLGFSGIEVGPVLDATTTLRLACRERVTVVIPAVGGDQQARLTRDLDEAGIGERHDLMTVDPPDVMRLLGPDGLGVVSMGRPAESDPVMFQAAAAAGALAARWIASS
jgi:hypothetical protein